MEEMHLTDERWRRWLSGTLSQDDCSDLAGHLEEGCGRCDDVLASMPGEPVDLIHGVGDDLRDERADVPEAVVAITFAAVMDRCRRARLAPAPDHLGPWYETIPMPHRDDASSRHGHFDRKGGGKPRKALGFFVGALTTAALSVLFAPFIQAPLQEKGPDREHAKEPGEGIKGTVTGRSEEPPPDVEVSFAVAKSGKVIRPGRTGESVPAGADLLFRFRVTGGPAYIYLVQEYLGKRTLVWPEPGARPEPVDGLVDLTVDGVLHGVPLTGLAGEVRFLALASKWPLARPTSGEFPSETTEVEIRVLVEFSTSEPVRAQGPEQGTP